MSIYNKYSSVSKVSCDILQGSIVGLLFILIYANDIKQAMPSDLLIYVDDSRLVSQRKQVRKVGKQLNNDFKNRCEWFLDNRLSINFGEN